MQSVVFLLTRDESLAASFREAVPQDVDVVVGDSVDAARALVPPLPCRAAVVSLDEASTGDVRPATFLGAIEDAVAGAPLAAIVSSGTPARDRQLVETVAERIVDGDAPVAEWLPALVDWIEQRPLPSTPLPSGGSQLPHRAIRGTTRSLVSFSPNVFSLMDELEIAASHDVTVLLIGETGCGKTHLARLMHEISPRREQPFLTIACGAIPADLVESELFGSVKGAFTGAQCDREGRFAAAGRGTLLLDEIDVLPAEHQAKLLRVIETGEFEPVGSDRTRHCEARLIVTSNRDLNRLVAAGDFRGDLLYRLNMLRFELPPLRERPLDVEFLARRFAWQHSRRHGISLSTVAPGFIAALRQHDWPGNVRELENVVGRAVLYCRDGGLDVDDLPAAIRDLPVQAAGNDHHLNLAFPSNGTLEARVGVVERQIIAESLKRNQQRRGETAKELGISRVTLYNKMKKLDLLVPRTAPVDAR